MSSGGEAVFAAAGPRSAAEDELAAAAAVLAGDGASQDTPDSELCGTDKTDGSTDAAEDVSEADKENNNVERRSRAVRSRVLEPSLNLNQSNNQPFSDNTHPYSGPNRVAGV